jgi:Tfp pilus assembly protein PilN
MANTRKMELSKRDMNFFSEFSSSAGQVGSYMSLILIVFIGILILAAAMYLVVALQSNSVRNRIDNLTNQMNNQKYAEAVVKYNENSAEIAVLNQKYFDISSLYTKVTGLDKIDAQFMDTIQEKLPADVIVTEFIYEKGSIKISGVCDTTYSPLDLIASLSGTSMFTYVSVDGIKKIDLTSYTAEEQATMKEYSFAIVGSLNSSYAVKISRFVDAVEATPLSAVESQVVDVGMTYELSNVQSFVAANGSTYSLSNVIINQIALDATNLAKLQQGGTYTIRVSSAVDIKLSYKLS